MMIFVALFLFISLFASIAVFGHRHYVKPHRMVEQLRGRFEPQTSTFDLRAEPVKAGWWTRWLGSAGSIFPASPLENDFTGRMLARAGFRNKSLVPAFYGTKIVFGVVCTALAFLCRDRITENPVLRIVVIAAGAALGYFGPGFVLESLVKGRTKRIGLSLADVLDLLVVCTEAGCALDLAILKVSKELTHVHPDICEELSLISLEMLAGKGRAEALRNFGTRTGDDEVKKLVAVLIQTDRFGTSVSEALRTQSEFLRIRRRQDCEERAGKVGVKLVFPIFFFCLPSLFIVTAGPGILQLIKNLFPMMKEFH